MIAPALKIIGQWPAYRQDFHDAKQVAHRLIIPNNTGRMRLLKSPTGKVCYTHTKLDRQLNDLPTLSDWLADGPHPWIMDLFYDRSVRAVDAMRAVSNDMIDQRIANEGEMVLFWRGVHKRFGYGVARRRTTNVIWT